MRTLRLLILLASISVPGQACFCLGSGTPCDGAGRSAAVFVGTVLDIVEPTRNAPPPTSTGVASARRPGENRSTAAVQPEQSPSLNRTVRLQVGEVLSGIPAGQQEIDVLTGQGGGDCGFAFRRGVTYFVYAYQNADGKLQTGICTRTRELTEAAEDLQYLHEHVNAPATSQLLVITAPFGRFGLPKERIIAEGAGVRQTAETTSDGRATFSNLPAGEYIIRSESEGDLPDDPHVRVYPKGCADVMRMSRLRITGRVTTKSGAPASRVEIQSRSATGHSGGSAMTDLNGHYELKILDAGQYHVGVNLIRSATRNTPFPAWFHPGTNQPATATVVTFNGKSASETLDLVLPDPLPVRTIEGTVLRPDGKAERAVRLTIRDAAGTLITNGVADPTGRFQLQGYADTAYLLEAVWPGDTPAEAVSSLPTEISPGTAPVNLRVVLTEQGNPYFKEQRQPAKARP